MLSFLTEVDISWLLYQDWDNPVFSIFFKLIFNVILDIVSLKEQLVGVAAIA